MQEEVINNFDRWEHLYLSVRGEFLDVFKDGLPRC